MVSGVAFEPAMVRATSPGTALRRTKVSTAVPSKVAADQIRRLLTEEQRKKYSLAGQPKDRAPNATGPTVEDWMKAANSN